jgi:alpha-L-fucosidase 2
MEGKNLKSLKMFYKKPGKIWLDSLPLGNGRIGAMVYGRVQDEIIQLDEATFWSGEASNDNIREGCQDIVKDIRECLFKEDYVKAKELCSKITGKKLNYGTHLPIGNIKIKFEPHDCYYSDFYRELDLATGISQVKYKINGSELKREVFVSNPHQVVAMKINSELPGKLSFKLSFEGIDNEIAVQADDRGDLIIQGDAYENIHSDGKTGVNLQGRIRVLNSNGSVSVQNGNMNITESDSVVLLIALRTNFECTQPFEDCLDKIEAASLISYEELRKEHIKDHSNLMGRISLELGDSKLEELPTDLRLERVKSGELDPGLDALMFNYGRYLVIGSSRENSPLPNHLQGIWNDNLACRMGWTCDMHLDINTQMNYWLTEASNISNCNTPLFNWIAEKLVTSGKNTAMLQYGCDGWTAHIVSNAWGFTAPGWDESWGIWPMGGVWIATHLWEHFLYTGDKKFLKEFAYPILKGAAEFVLGYLTEEPKSGYLVSGPSLSPENSFFMKGKRYNNSMGPTFNTILSREIFNICIEASDILKCDSDFSNRVKEACERLAPYKIGKKGELQEWFYDYEAGDPHHRHMSHLLSIYPFSQITAGKTPELLEAVKKSLELRLKPEGSFEVANWAFALITCYYARLENGNLAYSYMSEVIKKLTYNNLFVCHPVYKGYETGIYELDGNTGLSSAIIEMLIQSHDGIINLLPAIPDAWDKGYVKGICARGGFEVEMEWEKHTLKKISIKSKLGNPCTIKYGEKAEKLDIEAGKTLLYDFTI